MVLKGNPESDQNQNCLLVTRQNDNHSPGSGLGPGRLAPSSHQRSELVATPSSAPSVEEIRESGSAFQFLTVCG